MALKPLIAGMSQSSAGGAGGVPSGAAGGGLGGTYPNPTVNPQTISLTYTSGAIGFGLFTANNPNVNSTTVITISQTIAGTFSAGVWANLQIGCRLVFVPVIPGVPSIVYTDALPVDSSGDIQLSVNASINPNGTTWSGLYYLALIPVTNLDTDGTLTANSDFKIASQKATKTYTDSLAIALDSGWTPNADAGDKGVVIPGVGTIASNIATTVLGLDPTGTLGLNAALGHLASVAEKVKAIEYALSTQKRPNA